MVQGARHTVVRTDVGAVSADDEARKEIHKQQRQDEVERILVEGRFGVAKRRCSLPRIMRRMKETSESAIIMVSLVMNLDKRLRVLLLRIFDGLWSRAKGALRLLDCTALPRMAVWAE